jgi:hypothetical protein
VVECYINPRIRCTHVKKMCMAPTFFDVNFYSIILNSNPFKSIKIHWINELIQFPLKNVTIHSMEISWTNKKLGFSIMLHLKFNTNKRIPFKLKPTPLKNWKNKCKVPLNVKKNQFKNVSNGFWSRKWMEKRITV